MTVRAHAPGRVNLIGDHTDYTDGLVLPMAIDRGTTITAERTGDRVALVSVGEADPALVALDVADPAALEPPWARFVGAVVRELRPQHGLVGEVRTTLPVGAGLSSSSSFTVAVALAIGFAGSPLELALVCQQAETAASGVPGGIMDQLCIAGGVPGHALLIDCASLEVVPVPVPEHAGVVVVHSGQSRTLVGSAYAERRAQCEAAAEIVGPLRTAAPEEVAGIADPVLRRRARHVVTENARVLDCATALRSGDLAEAGRLMVGSHRSLATDFEVSTPALDALVEDLLGTPGVHGARLTGAGFGGCVVALCDAHAVRALVEGGGWSVRPVGGATVETL